MKSVTYGLILMLGFLGSVASAQVDVTESEVDVEEGSELNFLDDSIQTEPINNIEIKNINTQQVQSTRRVQKQPTVRIVGQELEDPSLRSIEQLNEEIYKTNGIVINEINKSRIEEEGKRRDKFLGKVQGLEGTEAQVQQQPVQVIQQESALDREALESRLSALEAKPVEEVIEDRTYFQAVLGFTEVPDAVNIKSDAAMGFGLGVKVKDRLMVEGNFIYTSYVQDYPIETNIEHYSGVGNLKYQMFRGMLRPVVGASVAYSYRTFEDPYFASGETVTSNAIDWGMLGGVDIELSDSFTLGTEFRYMWNLTSKTDGSYPYIGIGEKPLDEFSYYVLSLSGKFVF